MGDSDGKKMTFFLRNDVMKDSSSCEGETSSKFVQIRHPKSDSSVMLMYSPATKQLAEIVKFDEGHRSWIFGKEIASDGGMNVVTPVDPLLYLLPYLMKANDSGKYIPLDQIVVDSEYTEAQVLCSCVDAGELGNICTVKGDEDLKAYKYDEELTLSWLSKKMKKVTEAVRKQNVDIHGGSVSATFVKSKKSADNDSEEIVRYAFDIIDKYLPSGLSGKLKKHLNIKDPVPVVHEKPTGSEPPSKRAKKDMGTPNEDYSAPSNDKANKKLTRTTLAQKQLEKVDKKGMKSMSSFFSPKPKKPT